MDENSRRDFRNKLPLRDLELQILLALAEGERHGWSIVRELQQRQGGGKRILPGSFYRVLNGMLTDGLIEESDGRTNPDPSATAERRKYFRLTEFGISVCRAEVNRLEALVGSARKKALLSTARRV